MLKQNSRISSLHSKALSKGLFSPFKRAAIFLIILPLIAVIAGCGGKDLSIKYEVKNGMPEGYSIKTPLNITVIPYTDKRTGIKSQKKVADIKTNVAGFHGSELLLEEEVSVFVTNAIKEHLNSIGFKADIATGLASNRTLNKDSFSALPVDTDLVLSGEINRFHLSVAGRDKIEIELASTLYDRKSGRVLWSGTTVEENDRYAGVMGNTIKSLLKYINKSMNLTIRKLLKDSEPALMRYTTGASTAGQASDVQGKGHIQREADIAQTGTLKITSKPSEAKFYIDDTYYGKTPFTIDLKPGTYEVTVKLKGFKDEKEKIAVRPGITTELDVFFGE